MAPRAPPRGERERAGLDRELDGLLEGVAELDLPSHRRRLATSQPATFADARSKAGIRRELANAGAVNLSQPSYRLPPHDEESSLLKQDLARTRAGAKGEQEESLC